MHNGLVVASFSLVDCPAGAGGLAVVQGSHKANVGMPVAMRAQTVGMEFVTQASHGWLRSFLCPLFVLHEDFGKPLLEQSYWGASRCAHHPWRAQAVCKAGDVVIFSEATTRASCAHSPRGCRSPAMYTGYTHAHKSEEFAVLSL
jgi:ectoine hydroxylase-related dioxygenase (phytanoyl-CoA dioxygenase family)